MIKFTGWRLEDRRKIFNEIDAKLSFTPHLGESSSLNMELAKLVPAIEEYRSAPFALMRELVAKGADPLFACNGRMSYFEYVARLYWIARSLSDDGHDILGDIIFCLKRIDRIPVLGDDAIAVWAIHSDLISRTIIDEGEFEAIGVRNDRKRLQEETPRVATQAQARRL
ncbi:hypothetical protein [Xanthomonas axonopodis]